MLVLAAHAPRHLQAPLPRRGATPTHPALHPQLARSRQSTPWYRSSREAMLYPAPSTAALLPISAYL